MQNRKRIHPPPMPAAGNKPHHKRRTTKNQNRHHLLPRMDRTTQKPDRHSNNRHKHCSQTLFITGLTQKTNPLHARAEKKTNPKQNHAHVCRTEFYYNYK